jgi:23S rRNA pseudouridine1911/1915/1917 synthase
MKKRVFTRAPQDPEWLDALLSLRLALGLEEAQQLVTRGAVHVSGRRLIENERIAVGAKLIVFLDPCAPATEASLTVAFQDQWLAIVDKPPGVATQAERSTSDQALDAQVQRQLGGEARMMHRLDKEASGLVLFALRQEARAPLQQSLEGGLVERRYVAIVQGVLQGEGTIRLRIGRHPSDSRLRAAFPVDAIAGEPASSRYRTLARHDNITAVELMLETGRTHQLRVHLAAIGHPLVGDVAYGGPARERLCLHAHDLALPHPRTRERVEAHSTLPPIFSKLVPGLTRPFT